VRERDLEALEFDLVRQRLSGLALSPGGKQACLRLTPSPEREIAAAALDLAWQCFSLTEKHGRIALGEFPDVRAALHQAAHPGFILDGPGLVQVLTVLDSARRARAFLGAHARDSAGLTELCERIDPPEELRATLARSLDPDGNVTDDASDELAEVRNSQRRVRARIARQLAAMLERPNVADMLSDKFVTLRNNRYVLPVRTAAVPQFDGQIQDRSISGETTFIEPPFAIELNNQLLVAAREEERIVRKILADLTEMLRREAVVLEQTYAALVELDVLHARASFAREYRCTQPVFDDSEVRLLRARHPALLFAGREVVPVDVLLPPGKRVLVITGPNTGGKTVALKTVGLLALMAQAGIPIPAAEGSRLPCFRAIYADVGDDQSIERDLSTFSGHLANIKEILEHHERPSLIVLDEPGVGTDPEEGAALGIGVLSEFAAVGAWVAVTTHFAAIKAHALGDDAFVTAAVAYDIEHMQASYRLVYHSVGESLAVPIARRLGLPERILATAERARTHEARAFAEAMRELEASRRRYEEKLAVVDAELRASRAQQAEATQLLEELRRKREKHWHEELREAREYVRSVREEGRELLSSIARGEARRRKLDEFVERAATAIATHHDAVVDTVVPATDGPVCIGDQVEIGGTHLRGELVSSAGGRAWIQRGTMRFEVPAEGLRRVGSGAPAKAVPHSVQVQVERSEEGTALEISLLGMRAREALARLDTHLDRAVRDGVPSVRIIHGLGSGALRRAVGDYLATSPYCASFRQGKDAEGGAGVTIADLGS